jgi:fumarylacetoacetate (FAA) hydrolase
VACLSPVAVTPDELGKEWDTQGAALPLLVGVAGKPAVPQARADSAAGFADLVAQAARTRPLTAGAIVDAGAGEPDGSIMLSAGDTVRIEMKDRNGHSIFGAIEQTVQKQA